jgi:hypothetical protein
MKIDRFFKLLAQILALALASLFLYSLNGGTNLDVTPIDPIPHSSITSPTPYYTFKPSQIELDEYACLEQNYLWLETYCFEDN